MAQKAYVGIGNSAHNVKDIYIGVNGVARKVVKGYVGVNGVARQFWGGAPGIPDSWDYWTTVKNQAIMHFGETTISKSEYYGGITYYGYCYYSGNKYNAPGYYVIATSTSMDACALSITNPVSGMQFVRGTTGISYYGIDWYFGHNIAKGFDEEPIEDYLYIGEFSDLIEATAELVRKIYAVPMHEDYQVGQTYIFNTFANKRKTIRKALGVYLYHEIESYGSSTKYTSLSDNVDSIISNLLSNISNDNFIYIYVEDMGNDRIIYVYHYSLNSYTAEVQIRGINNGYDEAVINPSLPGSITREVVTIDSSTGTITYSTETVSDHRFYPWATDVLIIGIDIDSGSLSASNLGINL